MKITGFPFQVDGDSSSIWIDKSDRGYVLTYQSRVKVFYRMGDDRDFSLRLRINGVMYHFTSTLKTDMPGASVSLKLLENTEKGTLFKMTIHMEGIVLKDLDVFS